MTRHRQQITTLVLVSVAVIVLVLVAYYIVQFNQPRKISVPEVAFRETTGPASWFKSEDIPLEYIQEEEVTPFEKRQLAIKYLNDGRFLVAGWPECFIFLDDGSQESHITLDAVPDELFEEAGIDPEYGNEILNLDSVEAYGATESGRILTIFNKEDEAEVKDDEILLIDWDLSGEALSVTEIGQYIHPTSMFGTERYGRMNISTWGEQVLIMTVDGTFVRLEEGREPIFGMKEFLARASGITAIHCGNGFYTTDLIDLLLLHDLDGNIDWDWLERVALLLQPESLESTRWTHTPGLDWKAYTMDGNVMFPIRDEVIVVDRTGQVVQRYGDADSSWNLAVSLGMNQLAWPRIMQTDDGWIIINSTLGGYGQELVITDHNFAERNGVNFLPAIEEPSEEESETRELLTTGDYAYPKLIYTGLHSTPSGYRGIDHTALRVIDTDHDFNVTSVFDRTNPVDGLHQAIHVYKEDSRGIKYILDGEIGIVQVLDQAGHYIRRHAELGLDIFGEDLEPNDLFVDALDRLWIIGKDRIFVLNREGSLVRIFEHRGAPFTAVEPLSGLPPTEQRVQGYTIYSTSDPLSGVTDPTQPVTLEIGEYKWLTISSPVPQSPPLIYVEAKDSQTIHIFDWEGRERATIDPTPYSDSNVFRFMIGPDGFCYLLAVDANKIIVFTPLGEKLTTIEIEGLPMGDWWAPGLNTILDTPFDMMMVRSYIDHAGRLVVFRRAKKEVLVYPLRVDDEMEPMENQPVFTESVYSADPWIESRVSLE